MAPCDARPLPFPAPPALNGDPASGVSDPSAWRLHAPIVFVPTVSSLTYTCPTMGDVVGAAEAVAGTTAAAAPIEPSSTVLRHVRLSKRAKTRIAYLPNGLGLAIGPGECAVRRDSALDRRVQPVDQASPCPSRPGA